MNNRPHQLPDDQILNAAADEVEPGEFVYYGNNGPSILQEGNVQRGTGGHKCMMIVATAWGQGVVGGITPHGPIYLVFSYLDDQHKGGLPHFNKEVQFYFRDSDGNPFRMTMNKEVDGHYIDAVATGTALAYLQGSYKLPTNPEGTIDDLLDEGTSIGPYPTENT